eukprot:CAMPEP_0185567894 /NCGR_PEP_ID=MMETSP0434-20130131/1018_1 /TAXON_ID=626734 ORGANISM="Favella taraikaensis, Strain Fe Narragansett Bay" /NCGR_SAMPLE_ID=MMETSP0434 /ASSEMBLY_ACC=CAM_ASM_000379 /LENGTH=143 /DNA_ID=CAMNT_0028182233 /DNA_START=55 /DNA_END=486 /DNA_ORIENTATION=+
MHIGEEKALSPGASVARVAHEAIKASVRGNARLDNSTDRTTERIDTVFEGFKSVGVAQTELARPQSSHGLPATVAAEAAYAFRAYIHEAAEALSEGILLIDEATLGEIANTFADGAREFALVHSLDVVHVFGRGERVGLVSEG